MPTPARAQHAGGARSLLRPSIRAIAVVVLGAVSLLACGDQAGQTPLSEAEQRRTEDIVRAWPAAPSGSIEQVVTADECPDGPAYEEPRLLSEVIDDKAVWVFLTRPELQEWAATARPDPSDGDELLIPPTAPGLDGRPGVEVGRGAIDLALRRTEVTEWLVGIDDPGLPTGTIVALLEDGHAFYGAPCAFELYSYPIYLLVEATGATPAETWRAVATGDRASVLAALMSLDHP